MSVTLLGASAPPPRIDRFRRLLIRWEKKVENYVAMLHFACAWITFRAAGVIG